MVNPSSSSNSSVALEDDHNLRLSDATDASMDILANLEAPDSEAGHLLFESTSSGTTQAEIVERMLIDSTRGSSIISANMDDEVHRMSSSMHDLSFDPIYQHDGCEAANTRRNSLFLDGCDLGFHNPSRRASLVDNNYYTRRGRSPPATPNRPRKRISVKDVDFDPNPSYDAQNQLDDLSICSFNTAQTSQDNPLNSSFNSLLATNPDEQAKYHSALASLAESMKKTESSRRQVMLQRSLLTPEQRASLEEARNRQLQAIQTEALIPVQTQHHVRDLSPTRSNIMNQFFAGSRGTLTNGLEQSRRQLKSYMSQVQNQTL